MFRVARQVSGLTKAERRAKKLEREARAEASKGALWIVNRHCTRDEYPDLTEEEFQAKWEEQRARIEKSLLSRLRYEFSEKGEIEERIREELTRRCGREELAKEFVDLLDCRNREKSELMGVLIKLLQNQDLCRGQNVLEEWEEIIEPYRKELVRLMRRKRELDRRLEEEARQKAEAERQKAEAERQRADAERRAEEAAQRREEAARQRAEAERRAEEEAQRREEAARQRAEAERRAEEEAQRREEEARQRAEAERRAEEAAHRRAELSARLERYEREERQPGFFEGRGEERGERKRSASPGEEGPYEGKRARGANG